jgi:signal peptide peptidase SppA
MRYSAIVKAVYSSVWAILPEKLDAIASFLQMKLEGGFANPAVIAAIRAENQAAEARVKSLSNGKPGSVAVLHLYGIINQRGSGDFSGPRGTSVQEFTQQLRQAVNDPNVTAIVIDVDSPGGTVSGVDELAGEIFNARKQKKITAVSNCLCASAAYYLASQANEVCVSPSSLTGSIGVYQLHEDDSAALDKAGVKFTFISAGKFKVEGNNLQPLDDEARSAMQSVVDDYYDLFVRAVARGRGVALKSVTEGYGQGRCLTAKEAVKQGLADRIATLDDVLAKYGVSTSGASAEVGAAPIVASAEPKASGACQCDCEECLEGDCSECTHDGCDAEAEGCVGCPMSIEAKATEQTAAAAEAEARARRMRLASF